MKRRSSSMTGYRWVVVYCSECGDRISWFIPFNLDVYDKSIDQYLSGHYKWIPGEKDICKKCAGNDKIEVDDHVWFFISGSLLHGRVVETNGEARIINIKGENLCVYAPVSKLYSTSVEALEAKRHPQES